jgi:cellulose synthase (UDP-forming)
MSRTLVDGSRARSDSDSRTSSLRLLLWVYAAVALAYMAWRLHSTLSMEYMVFGVSFYVAEAWSLASSLIFYAMLSKRPRDTNVSAPREGLSVDVFVATYNESLELVRSTAVAARDMHYPHQTWICDDGRRPEMRALADELGVGYISRPDNAHFKAGNLNNAMSQTTGDFVVVLDADHLLAADFLTSLLGYFEEDSELALVQIPQVYYNVDSYQHALSDRRRMLWHEASLFHHRMQPGADAYGAAFFVGTGAILRRSALQAVGGIATG